MKIGYARVSTLHQDLSLQLSALNDAGCEKVFCEKKSAFKERREFDNLMNVIRRGDVLVVWKLDRYPLTFFDGKKALDDWDYRDNMVVFNGIPMNLRVVCDDKYAKIVRFKGSSGIKR